MIAEGAITRAIANANFCSTALALDRLAEDLRACGLVAG
jgi:hypothetical protein